MRVSNTSEAHKDVQTWPVDNIFTSSKNLNLHEKKENMLRKWNKQQITEGIYEMADELGEKHNEHHSAADAVWVNEIQFAKTLI